jgi:hypothetical protein
LCATDTAARAPLKSHSRALVGVYLARQQDKIHWQAQKRNENKASIADSHRDAKPTNLHVHPKKKNTYGKRTASLSPAIPWSPDQLEIVNYQQCPTDQAIPA